MGYIGMCGPKGYGFSAVLVINGVSILVINRVSIFALSLNSVFVFTKSYFFSMPSFSHPSFAFFYPI